MSRVSLSSWSGYVKVDDLLGWLNDGNVQGFIKDACGLMEYVYRFKLACGNELIEDINRDEIGKYCLRARIFKDNCQIFFRRIEPELFQVLILSEDKGLNLADGLFREPSTEDFEIRDRSFILWGTYDDEINGYREDRVSVSRIEYPGRIGNGDYPVLQIREYLDEKGDVVVWRFRGLASAKKGDLQPDIEVSDEKG